jgi:hypothetical protein
MERDAEILVALDDRDAVALEADVSKECILGCRADKHNPALVDIGLKAVAAKPSIKAEHGILHRLRRIADNCGIISKEEDPNRAVGRKTRNSYIGGLIDCWNKIVDEDVEEKRAERAALADTPFHWEGSTGRTRGRGHL